MKFITNLKTAVEGDKVTITADIKETNERPWVVQQITMMHVDENNPRWISHAQLCNHGFMVKLPNKQIGFALPMEEYIQQVARVIEPALCPPSK